jgi:hypothetical protein
MPPSTAVAVVYCVDEDVYVEAGADFWTVAPPGNLVAAGSDGAFAGGDLWTLLSASNNFAGQGVTSGMVIQLSNTAPTTGVKASVGPFKQPQTMAIDSATSNSVTLRRSGEVLGFGMPPGLSGGLAGVTFRILTLGPQIENTAYKLNEAYSIDPRFPNYRTLYDPRIFRRLTALRVMYLQYANANRAKTGDFADKISFYHSEYLEELDTATVRWGPNAISAPASNRFSTKLSR